MGNWLTRDAYNASAVIIFVVMAFTFLFPCNKLIPLDRRTVAVLCAMLCYVTRTYAFSDRSMNVLEAVDFDVLILLASIMALNHIVVHLQETKSVIKYIQTSIQQNPNRGFWMVSLAAFIVSPFLTNDGVCLLFVEPILNAFESAINKDEQGSNEDMNNDLESKLHREDAMYFMVTLACSANIGSALTYTGTSNPLTINHLI